MGNVEYRILAYAQSEYVTSGVDFFVIFRLEGVAGSALRAYLWDGWETLTVDADEITVEYLDAFVHDTRRHLVPKGEAIDDAFFEAIDDMNIGPLRTSASGRCTPKDLQLLLPSILDPGVDIRFLSVDRITLLTEHLRRSQDQLQAART